MALIVSRKPRFARSGRARSSTTTTVSYTHREEYRGHELETDCTATVTIEPGEREIRYGDSACPGSDPEVTIDSVVVDATGEDITDEADPDSIREAALENYSDDPGDDDDRAYEEMKDRRLMGDD